MKGKDGDVRMGMHGEVPTFSPAGPNTYRHSIHLVLIVPFRTCDRQKKCISDTQQPAKDISRNPTKKAVRGGQYEFI